MHCNVKAARHRASRSGLFWPNLYCAKCACAQTAKLLVKSFGQNSVISSLDSATPPRFVKDSNNLATRLRLHAVTWPLTLVCESSNIGDQNTCQLNWTEIEQSSSFYHYHIFAGVTDLDLWLLDLESLSLIGCHVIKHEQNRTICGWFSKFLHFSPSCNK